MTWDEFKAAVDHELAVRGFNSAVDVDLIRWVRIGSRDRLANSVAVHVQVDCSNVRLTVANG